MRYPAVLLALLPLLAAPLPGQRVKMLVPLTTLAERAVTDSNDAPTRYEAALGFWLAHKYDEAERQLRAAIAIEPSLAQAYLALSFLPYARREKLWDEVDKGKVPPEWVAAVNESEAFRRRAFLLDPLVDLKPLALMIAPPSAFGLGGNAKAVYTYLMNGFGAFWDGQYGTAYQFFRELAGTSTDEDRKQKFGAWFLWYEALAAAHAHDYPRAETDFRILLERAQTVSNLGGGATLAFTVANQYRYALACVLDEAGERREAVDMLKEVLTEDVGFYPAHTRLAHIYEDQHRVPAALEERRRAVATSPDDPSLLFDLGEALARAGELAEAQGVLRQAVAANPRSHRALYVLAAVAQQVGSTDEAREMYTRFLAIAPSRFADQKAAARARLDSLP